MYVFNYKEDSVTVICNTRLLNKHALVAINLPETTLQTEQHREVTRTNLGMMVGNVKRFPEELSLEESSI